MRAKWLISASNRSSWDLSALSTCQTYLYLLSLRVSSGVFPGSLAMGSMM